jgi:acetyl-CoA/propionyl-CoA carboxylase biotin carboxyl carrier protein
MAESVDVVAPVPGLVASVPVKVGGTVAAGDPVVMLQAMKAEIAVEAELAGTVEAILVKEGEEVDIGAVLARVRPG